MQRNASIQTFLDSQFIFAAYAIVRTVFPLAAACDIGPVGTEIDRIIAHVRHSRPFDFVQLLDERLFLGQFQVVVTLVAASEARLPEHGFRNGVLRIEFLGLLSDHFGFGEPLLLVEIVELFDQHREFLLDANLVVAVTFEQSEDFIVFLRLIQVRLLTHDFVLQRSMGLLQRPQQCSRGIRAQLCPLDRGDCLVDDLQSLFRVRFPHPLGTEDRV